MSSLAWIRSICSMVPPASNRIGARSRAPGRFGEIVISVTSPENYWPGQPTPELRASRGGRLVDRTPPFRKDGLYLIQLTVKDRWRMAEPVPVGRGWPGRPAEGWPGRESQADEKSGHRQPAPYRRRPLRRRASPPP